MKMIAHFPTLQPFYQNYDIYKTIEILILDY